jgi:hypothetical protein
MFSCNNCRKLITLSKAMTNFRPKAYSFRFNIRFNLRTYFVVHSQIKDYIMCLGKPRSITETGAPTSDVLMHEGLPVGVKHIRATIHFHPTKLMTNSELN